MLRYQHSVSGTDLCHRADSIVSVIGTTIKHDVRSHVLAQRNNLIAVASVREIEIPLPIAVFDWSGVQREFDTRVLNVSSIDKLCFYAREVGNIDRHDLISRVFTIVSEVNSDATIHESPVKSYLPSVLTLWFEVRTLDFVVQRKAIYLVISFGIGLQFVSGIDVIR